jgi:hypothetical protein
LARHLEFWDPDTDYSEEVLDFLLSLPMVATLDVAYGVLLVAVAVGIAWVCTALFLKLFKNQD